MDNLVYLAPTTPPVLKYGAHLRPEDGTCVMEYASTVLGAVFGDNPKDIEVMVSMAAQSVNDYFALDDAARSRELVPLLPRILAARPIPGNTQAGRRACQRLAEHVTAVDWMLFNSPRSPRHDAHVMRWFVGVIDFYEELMGDIGEPVRRIEVVPVPEPSEAPVKEPSPAPAREPEKVPA